MGGRGDRDPGDEEPLGPVMSGEDAAMWVTHSPLRCLEGVLIAHMLLLLGALDVLLRSLAGLVVAVNRH